MKKIHLLLAVVLSYQILLAQAPPQGINYQAVLRNAAGVELATKTISVRMSLYSGSITGTLQYQETHGVSTNQFGLFTVVLGKGQATGATGPFNNVNWAAGAMFLEVEVDTSAGTAFTSIGVTQLMSVPYALYAGATASSAKDGLNCWDLDGDGVKDPAEDANNDGKWDAGDCKGATGIQGPAGPAGNNGVSITWLGTLSAPPSSPTLNQAYYNSLDKKSYVWNGLSWHVLAQDGATGATGSPGTNGISISWLGTFSSAPVSPALNQAYYNSTDKRSYIWNGSSWQILAQDGAAGGVSLSGTYGQTIWYDGSKWAASSFLHNNHTGKQIGIGTTNPTEKLHVFGSSLGASEKIKIETESLTGNAGIEIEANNGVNNELQIVQYSDNVTGSKDGISFSGLSRIWSGTEAKGLMFEVEGSGPMYFLTKDRERMRLSSDGNLGLGNTNPLDKLSVMGDIYISRASGQNPKLKIYGVKNAVNWSLGIDDVNNGNFILSSAAELTAPKISVTKNGNVGLNTNAPATDARLAIKDGHIQVQQTTMPTIAVIVTGAGTGATASLSSSPKSTDVSGQLSLTTGTGNYNTGAQVVVTFNIPYKVEPFVIITPANEAAGNSSTDIGIYVTSTTTGFTVNFSEKVSSQETYRFNYMVIETE